ncbi:DUF4910 domain-containing protein [Maridesulfovibrio ferrireducens]|nr:DUF4910 domain-containing protein [Maridesulfovibrio ferrireducens]
MLTKEFTIGAEIKSLVRDLFPICRSLTGNGVRETLRIISETLPLNLVEIPSGTKVFDWEIPNEWNIEDAYIKNSKGVRIVDFKKNNLHVVGYSTPIDKRMPLAELEKNLHSIAEQPDAIPYVTSYYNKNWGFCLTHNDREKLQEDDYHVVIKSTLEPGSLTYAETFIPGESDQEILLSSYVCHPSMANNELSGPSVLAYIGKWLLEKKRRYSYRIILIPETIGSITYISKNFEQLKKNTIAGFNLSCIGDERHYSNIETRYGETLSDRVVKNLFKYDFKNNTTYSFLERGSDERQFCSPGVDLPIVGLCRSKYNTYPEYHTSLDNLDLVTAAGLSGGYQLVKESITSIEKNYTYKVNNLCEPQLGKRGLYPNISQKGHYGTVNAMMNFLAYADGTNDLISISDRIGVPMHELFPIVQKMYDNGLISTIETC